MTLPTTEAEMKDFTVPTFSNLDDLTSFIREVTTMEHDYGTAVYALSLATTATFNHVASKLGVTGFQTSCADLDLLRRVRGIDGPFGIVLGSDMLYPQYDLNDKIIEWKESWSGWAAEESARLYREFLRSEELSSYAAAVIRHWEAAAQSELTSEELSRGALRIHLQKSVRRPEDVVAHCDSLQRVGVKRVHLIKQEPEWAKYATTAKYAGSVRLDTQICFELSFEVGEIRCSWYVNTEKPEANGTPTLAIDFGLLEHMTTATPSQEVRAFIGQYIKENSGDD